MPRQSNKRIPCRVIFGTIAGEESARPGEQCKTWQIFIVEDLREFHTTEGSTEHPLLVFGVETALSFTAAKMAGIWYRRILEAAKRFVVRRHKYDVHTHPPWVVR